MFTKLFVKDALERAAKTFAQTFIAVVGFTVPTANLGLLDINYVPVVMVSLIAAVLSLLSSVASAGTGSTGSASLVVDTKPLK